MTELEIREYLAVNLFSGEHYRRILQTEENYKRHLEHRPLIIEKSYENYQQVIEAIIPKIKGTLGREFCVGTNYAVIMADLKVQAKGVGDTIGEAVCRCAVEYLKSREGKGNGQ